MAEEVLPGRRKFVIAPVTEIGIKPDRKQFQIAREAQVNSLNLLVFEDVPTLPSYSLLLYNVSRCRCHSSCRRSRFSGLGIQICGKLFSSISLRSSRASSRSNFCFFTRFALISAGSPIHSSNPNSASSRSNQREYPVASFPTRTPIPRCFRSQ